MANTYKHGNIGKRYKVTLLQWIGQVLSPSEKNHINYFAAVNQSTFDAILVELSQPVGDGVVLPVHVHLVPLLLVDVWTNLDNEKRKWISPKEIHLSSLKAGE